MLLLNAIRRASQLKNTFVKKTKQPLSRYNPGMENSQRKHKHWVHVSRFGGTFIIEGEIETDYLAKNREFF